MLCQSEAALLVPSARRGRGVGVSAGAIIAVTGNEVGGGPARTEDVFFLFEPIKPLFLMWSMFLFLRCEASNYATFTF